MFWYEAPCCSLLRAIWEDLPEWIQRIRTGIRTVFAEGVGGISLVKMVLKS